MRLLQFSTSHYCRKVRLALGYKQIPYEVENLTPGAHRFKLKPLVGLTTVPVLLPESASGPVAVGDSTEILKFLEGHTPEPSWTLGESQGDRRAWLLEDWLDESIGTATRFLYYDFRAKEGKSVNPSWFAQTLVKVVRFQYDISPARVTLARQRLRLALAELGETWRESPYLVGDRLSVADLAAAGLLSPLALIPQYRQEYPWLFERIEEIHQHCHEPLPPGLT
ncbi:glutathione S-transferase family protein [Geitlerinema sp. P-1104]|uniref:glutathione S-transferase family protein n=1 Tax=Geitlerinema sp. P-1104 TaxID=2546230 RepID=UPI0014776BD3|nr:glutathione S-transferase family protein [Geitlerinema sp. P-1104]NMG57373.1 glutathione S-transferase family protein [Geitlerinema sp. P-1104]